MRAGPVREIVPAQDPRGGLRRRAAGLARGDGLQGHELTGRGSGMNETKMANLGLLLRCYEGLRNWRALAMLVAGFVLAMLLAVMGATITAKLGGGVTALLFGGVMLLLAVLVALAGYNGAGLLLVDQADGHQPRGFLAAFFGGVGVTLQALACLVLLAVGMLLVVLVLWALSFLAAIPGIGSLFAFLLAGPTMLVLAFCYAVLAFGVALMYVALWRGNGIIGSIGRAIDIVIKRPLDVVLHFIVLVLLVVPIQVFVTSVLFGASFLTGAMYVTSSASGGGGGYGGYGGYGASAAERIMSGMTHGAASMGAAGVSIGMVLAAILAGFALIYVLGIILIYDSLAAETSATSAGFLQDKVRQIKEKVEEHRPQAPAAPRPFVPSAAPAGPVAPAPQPAASATVARCASCGAALAPGDRFCGECGAPAA
jgi:hypothetical protein